MPSPSSAGIYPPPLLPSDTIALLSPSSRLNETFPLRLHRAVQSLTTLNFTVKTIYTPLPTPCSHTQQIQHRVNELHSAFLDPEVKAIICTIGGLSCNELLPFIDWEVIRSHPKVVVGYSDVTVLLLGMFAMAGLRGFYGPAAITQFGEVGGPLGFTAENFFKVVCEGGREVGKMPRSREWTDEFGDWGSESVEKEREGTLKRRKLQENMGWRWLRRGRCEGRIMGGCLPSLLQLAGTKYWPDMKGRILLLENSEGEKPDGPLPLEQTRSLMADLTNLGVWDQIVGLVVGRPTGYVGEELGEFEDMVRGVCEVDGRWEFPILFGVDVGHTDPMVTVPLNALSRLDSGEDVWEILEPGVM